MSRLSGTVRWPLLFVLLGITFLVSRVAPAQLSEPLTQAYGLRGEGHYTRARAAFLARLAVVAKPSVAANDAAALADRHGEIDFLIASVRELDGFLGTCADTADRLAELETREGSGAAAIRYLLAEHRLRSLLHVPDRVEEAIALTQRLGYIGCWSVVGPFDNERGRGMRRKLPPERGIDLAADYRGKVRQVSWRTVDATQAVGGYVNLDELLRPDDQALAYATTTFVLEQARTLVFHLGSDEAVALRVDGVKVLSRAGRRPFRHGQDRVAVRLSAGTHRLLLKVGDQEGAWGFALAVTGVDGEPVGDLGFTGAKPEPGGAKAAAGGAPAVVPVPWHGRARFARAAEEGDAAAAFKLAVILLDRQPDDAKAYSAAKPAQRAAGAEGAMAWCGLLVAKALNRSVRISAEKEGNRRREALERAVKLDPRFAEGWLTLASYHLDETSNLTRAEALVDRALAINPEFAAAQLYRIWLLGKRDWPLERRLALEAFVKTKTGGAYPEALDRLARTEMERGLVARAGALATEAHRRGAGSSAFRTRVRALMAEGKEDEARARLEGALVGRPFAARARTRLADFHEGAGRLEEAMAWVRKAIEIAPEEPNLHTRLARLAGLQGQRVVMIAHLKRALELNPKLAEVERHLRHLNATERPFYADLELDAAARLKADTGPSEEAVEAAVSHYYLFRHRVAKVNPDGTRSDYGRFVARVRTETGVRRLKRFSVPFSAYDQQVRILEARVHRADGSIQRGVIRSGGSRSRFASARFPSLRVGDAVEIAWRRDDLRQSFFGDYFGLKHLFQASDLVPVRESRLDLIVPAERRFQFQTKNGAPEAECVDRPDGGKRYTWVVKDLKGLRTEVAQPRADEFAPLVAVTTYESWDAFASWWWNLIREQTRADEAIKAKVAELTAQRSTREEKIRAIYDFVVTDINYTAWEFGVHGYKPYEASAIFARRFGDCKDKAILLCTMLAEVGVTAWPVIIHADLPKSKDDLTLPMVEHFNHCIAWLPDENGDGKGTFLDGTATGHPFGVVPDMDKGATVLVVENGKAKLRDVPWGDPAANREHADYDIELRPDGSALVRVVFQPTGSSAVTWRRRFQSEVGERNKQFADRFARDFGKITIKEAKLSDLGDLAVPVKIEVTFEVAQFLRPAEDGCSYLAFAFRRNRLSGYVATAARERDLLLRPPQTWFNRIRYRLPAGFEADPLPEATTFTGPHGRYRLALSRGRDWIEIEHEVALTAPRITRDTYPAFQGFVQGLDRAEAETIRLSKKEGGQSR